MVKKQGRSVIFLTAVSFVLPRPAIESWKWRMYCGANYQALLPAQKKGPDFVKGVDFPALGSALRKDLGRKFYETKPVPFALPDGTKYSMRIGRATTSEKMILELLDGDQEISTIHFTKERGSSSAYLSHVETKTDFGGRRANEALLRAMLQTFPDVRIVQARLASINFKAVADALTPGKDQSHQISAEDTVAQALATGRRDELARAVESSPTGKQMKALGFVVDLPSLYLHKVTSTDDEDGPLLEVIWKRVGDH